MINNARVVVSKVGGEEADCRDRDVSWVGEGWREWGSRGTL